MSHAFTDILQHLLACNDTTKCGCAHPVKSPTSLHLWVSWTAMSRHILSVGEFQDMLTQCTSCT